MLKKLLVILFIFLSFKGHAQKPYYTKEDLKDRYGINKQLEITRVEEQKKDGVYKPIKITKYTLDFDDMGNITKQVVNDTIYGKPVDRAYSYEYSQGYNTNLIKQTETRLSDGTITKTIHYTNKDDGVLLTKKETIDEQGDVIETITYETGDCDNAYLTEDDKKAGIDYCEIITVQKLNLSYKIVHLNKDGYLFKELNFANNKPDELHSITEYMYDDNWNLVKEITTMQSTGKSTETIYEYNENGILTHKKAGWVEFFYEYSYEENGNVLKTIETPKSGSKRWVEYKKVIIKQ